MYLWSNNDYLLKFINYIFFVSLFCVVQSVHARQVTQHFFCTTFSGEIKDTVRQSDINPREYFRHYIGYLYAGVGATSYTSNYSTIDYFHQDFNEVYSVSGSFDIPSSFTAFGIDLAIGPFGEKNAVFYPLVFSYHQSDRFRVNRIASGAGLALPFLNKKKSHEYPRFWMEMGVELSYRFFKTVIDELCVSKGDPILQSFDPYFLSDSVLQTNGFYQLSALSGTLAIEPMLSLNYRISNHFTLRFAMRSVYSLYEERFRMKMDYKPRWGIDPQMYKGDFFILPTETNFSAEGEVVNQYPVSMVPLNMSLGLVFRLKSDLGRAGREFPRYRPN